jgi:hypothetical protein
MKKIILISLLTLASIGTARSDSGLFLEPMVTYETGTGDINFPAPINSSESKVRGFGVGARFGLQLFEIFFAGVDGRYSMPNLKDTSLNQDTDSKSWNLGPLVGIQMPTPIGLRFWGSWILAGELDPDKDKGVDEKFKSGNGFRLGSGFRIAMVSLNAEYQYVKYDKTTIDQIGIFTTGFNSNDIALTNKSLILSVSFPIGL